VVNGLAPSALEPNGAWTDPGSVEGLSPHGVEQRIRLRVAPARCGRPGFRSERFRCGLAEGDHPRMMRAWSG
jgi:hypothetical protein